ncbi:unnamed protein product [Nippostrongylus brasiliensis]|uniref:N-acetylgalactosaminide beta-1,3-galactosyltransferase n=1 Tax=Nippostrongylus brasiliensis TaxID=27835 RepID=A0A158QWN0_NIPBR|nr:unnamed protein product [Nippostrongylus brasiliensis]
MSPDVPYSTPFTNVPDAYSYLFRKTIVAFHYAFTKISDKFDWYFKADDDTYVIMEHMYEYLEKFNPNEPYYFGYRMKPHLVRGYNGGGGGYVLSRAAVKLFLDRAFYNRKICPFDNNEDVGMGRCLQNLEIFPYDTRNEKGQHRFHTYRPDVQFNGAIANEWHFYPQKTVSNTYLFHFSFFRTPIHLL